MIPEDKLVRDLWDFESQALKVMDAYVKKNTGFPHARVKKKLSEIFMSLNSMKDLIEVISEQPIATCRAGYEICKGGFKYCVIFKCDDGWWSLEKILWESTFSIKPAPTLKFYTVKYLSNALNKRLKKIGFNTFNVSVTNS